MFLVICSELNFKAFKYIFLNTVHLVQWKLVKFWEGESSPILGHDREVLPLRELSIEWLPLGGHHMVNGC